VSIKHNFVPEQGHACPSTWPTNGPSRLRGWKNLPAWAIAHNSAWRSPLHVGDLSSEAHRVLHSKEVMLSENQIEMA